MTNLITSGDFSIDEETGEIIEENLAKIRVTVPQYVPQTIDDVEWVLQLMQAEESEIAGLNARKTAILEMLNAEIERHEKKLNAVVKRFAADLEQFAKKELEGQKSRSWKSPFGTLAFRKTPGSVKPLEGAIEWASRNDPEAVEIVPKLLVSKLKTDRDALPVAYFEVTPAGENFSIKTGIL